MKPLKDCRYSAFISYSHAADEAHGGWVSQFHEELYTTLKGRLRRDVGGAVPPMHLSGDNGPVAGSLSRELERNIADSFAMIIVVDENYLDSSWCLKELEYFRTLFGEQGFEERLYVVAMSEPAMSQLAAKPDWVRLVPPDVMRELRAEAAQRQGRPASRAGLVFIVCIWLAAFAYKQKVYRFVVNGQTGKVTGEAPTSYIKVALVVGAVVFVILLIVAIVAMASR